VWDDKLLEGETYIMHNFKILKNDGQYRVCEHPFKLLFIGATSVKPQPIANIPKKVYEFQSILEVVAGNFCADLLIGMSHRWNLFISLNNLLLLFFVIIISLNNFFCYFFRFDWLG